MTPEISLTGPHTRSVNAATSISTVALAGDCDSILSITTNNDDVKDCKIRKSLLASQYYLFWLSFYTEAAKTSFVKMLDQHKHWLRIIEWESCSHWHDWYSSSVFKHCRCNNTNDDKIESFMDGKCCVLLCLCRDKSQTSGAHAMIEASVNAYIQKLTFLPKTKAVTCRQGLLTEMLAITRKKQKQNVDSIFGFLRH